MISAGELTPCGQEGELAEPAGGTDRGDGLLRSLPGGGGLRPEPVAISGTVSNLRSGHGRPQLTATMSHAAYRVLVAFLSNRQ